MPCFFLDFLREKETVAMNVNATDRIETHRTILQRKPLMREVFTECHCLLRSLAEKYLSGEGLSIELGAGVAPMQDAYPDVLATDIVPSPHLDRPLDAENMDLPDASVKVFYGQNCFHHFPHPDRFFDELTRVLVPGGGAVLLEPYYGPAASFIYKRIFSNEGFDKTAPWETETSGPMQGTNQALSYIVFVRDRALFEQKYPALQIVAECRMDNYLKYLFSGGLNFRQLWPDALAFVLEGMQWLLRPVNGTFALHHVTVIQKRSHGTY